MSFFDRAPIQVPVRCPGRNGRRFPAFRCRTAKRASLFPYLRRAILERAVVLFETLFKQGGYIECRRNNDRSELRPTTTVKRELRSKSIGQ